MKKLKMRNNKTNGVLITFCGLDGSGKSTMIKHLVASLCPNTGVYLTKQPTDTVRKSDIFRTYMDDPDHSAYDYRSLSLLAASDRLQHVTKVIEPHLEAGNMVICDRYFYSCLANLRARGFSSDRWIYEIAESVVKPDISFFLDLPVDIAVARVRSRALEKNRYIDMDLQYKLRQEYLDICKANNGVLISTDIPLEDTFQHIINNVHKVLETRYGCK